MYMCSREQAQDLTHASPALSLWFIAILVAMKWYLSAFLSGLRLVKTFLFACLLDFDISLIFLLGL